MRTPLVLTSESSLNSGYLSARRVCAALRQRHGEGEPMRHVVFLFRFLVICAVAVFGFAALPRAETKTLRVVPENDIVLLDPVFGTAGISAVGGLMIYETLFTWDAKLQPQPEMAAK